MKFLKYLLGFIVLMTIAFFFVGVLVPSFTYTSRIEVSKPVQEAFAVFSDGTRMGDWMQGFESIEHVSGEKNAVGSKYKLVIVENGERMEMLETMTAFEKNRHFAFNIENQVMFVDVEVDFFTEGEKTRISASHKVEGRNIFWKSLLPLFKPSIESRSQENYDRLKTIIESATS